MRSTLEVRLGWTVEEPFEDVVLTAGTLGFPGFGFDPFAEVVAGDDWDEEDDDYDDDDDDDDDEYFPDDEDDDFDDDEEEDFEDEE